MAASIPERTRRGKTRRLGPNPIHLIDNPEKSRLSRTWEINKARTEAMVARIFKPAKTAMQSGRGRTKEWALQFEPSAAREIEPLMGWTSSADTQSQVRLSFESKDEAIAYAERNGIPYRLEEQAPRKLVKKSYSDNFKYGRVDSWTH
jgi:NADH dehydrogenase ubiquinone Fe-S protein 4